MLHMPSQRKPTKDSFNHKQSLALQTSISQFQGHLHINKVSQGVSIKFLLTAPSMEKSAKLTLEESKGEKAAK